MTWWLLGIWFNVVASAAVLFMAFCIYIFECKDSEHEQPDKVAVAFIACCVGVALWRIWV